MVMELWWSFNCHKHYPMTHAFQVTQQEQSAEDAAGDSRCS